MKENMINAWVACNNIELSGEEKDKIIDFSEKLISLMKEKGLTQFEAVKVLDLTQILLGQQRV